MAPVTAAEARARTEARLANLREFPPGRPGSFEKLVNETADVLAALLAALDTAERERDEALKRVGQADAQRMVAMRKNDERIEDADRAEAFAEEWERRCRAAEGERDTLRAALLAIAEGNLGGDPWLADYRRIQEFASHALASSPVPAGEET